MRTPALSVTALIILLHGAPASAQTAGGAPPTNVQAKESLAGLWKAKRRFGPDERGPLILEHKAQGWVADFLGRSWRVMEKDGVLSFAFPGNRGAFRARLRADKSLETGQWFQLGSTVAPNFGTNIAFRSDGRNRWIGQVRPVDESFTLYLMAERLADGTVTAFIRNPERNIGLNLGVERIESSGDAVSVIGKRLGRTSSETVMSGRYDRASRVLRLYLPERGGSYDFRREGDDSDFWPRGRNPGRYVYQPPVAHDDGWPVGTLDETNIDRRGIESFIQWILDTPMDTVNAHEVHGILIARAGRLVLEEYFHGYHRDRLHDTRSAAKSLTATLVGAVLQSDLPLRLTDPVYRILNGGRFPPNLDDPRKRSMQLQHLLTMTSGIHCDDSDPKAPGNENKMTDQTDEPDYYRHYMKMPMDRQPGERAIYCSGDPNLAIGVLSHATGEHAMDLFDRYLAQPLKIDRHGWFLSPSLQPYGGGSVQILPRDLLKIGQLMANRGTWQGRRVLSREFADRASGNLCPLNKVGYGYLWWTVEYPYKDRTVRAYFAGGNGGQGIFVIPELDLVIGTFGGSFTSHIGLEIQQGYIPRYILPAVREKADSPDAPVTPRSYKIVYGLQRPAPPCPQTSFLPAED